MSSDGDIAAALPEPPPPRPARRDAAIEAALQRFDGGGAADRPRIATPPPWRGRIVRPQFAAFATIALVALIGLPVWLSGDHQFGSVSREAPVSAVPGPVSGPVSGPAPGPVPNAVPGAAPGPAVSGPVARQAPAASSSALAAAPSPVVSPKPESAPGSPPSAAVADARCAGGNCNAPVNTSHLYAREAANMSGNFLPQAQAVEEKRLDKDVVARRQNRVEFGYSAPPPPPPPPAGLAPAPPSSAYEAAAPRAPVVAGRVAEEDISAGAGIVVTGARARKSFSEDMVVTAQRRSTAKPIGRGDWNACTVNDPNRRLSACKKLVDPAASGPAGQAATHIADGLSLAWQDDFDGAIAAFDQAIAVSPRLSFAYLNRGLAYVRMGDLKHALADLDQAVRYAPNAARAYYSRSLVLRQRGDTRRAEADEARAVDLDQRYEAVVQ